MSVALGLMSVIVLKSVLEDVFQEKYRIFRFIYESIRRTACDDSSRGELMVTIKEKGKVITGREGDVRWHVSFLIFFRLFCIDFSQGKPLLGIQS